MAYPDFERKTTSSRPPPPDRATDGARLLLADRDNERRSWYAGVLGEAGYQVVGVGEMAEALAQVAVARPALIIAHVSEPVAEGMALCRTLRKERETCDLPVIIVIRVDDPFTREQIVRFGASGILTERPGRALLLRQVKRLMARARAHPATGEQQLGIEPAKFPVWQKE